MGFSDEASRGKMEQEALKECAQHIIKLQECAPDGIAFYEIWWKCTKQRKETEICLGPYGRDKAVLEKMKREYSLHPKGGKGPAET